MQLSTRAITTIHETTALRASPRHRAVLAILPFCSQLSLVRECREGTVVGEFGHEGFPGWKLKELALGRRHGIAATIGLHPPFGLGEIVERVHGEVGVGVVDRRVIAALESQNGVMR